MDSLVAKYSRPAYEHDDSIDRDEAALGLMDPTAHLSLNFAMPPIAQVSSDGGGWYIVVEAAGLGVQQPLPALPGCLLPQERITE